MVSEHEVSRRQVEFGKEPLIFAGQPPHLHGSFDVKNVAGKKLRLSSVALSGLDLRLFEGNCLDRVPAFGLFAPGERKKVRVHLALQPQTPPGVYEGRLECAGEQRAVTVHVLETWRLSVNPANISIKTSPEQKVVRSVHVTNEGNMPYTLHRAIFAPLKEQDGVHRALYTALKEASTQGGDKTLDAFVRELGEREVKPLTVKVRSGSRVLDPGASSRLELEFEGTESLKRHCLYVGTVPFENASLGFDIEIVDQPATANRGTTK